MILQLASVLCVFSVVLAIPVSSDAEQENPLSTDIVQARIKAFFQSLQGDAVPNSSASVSLEEGADKVLVFFECGPGQAECVNGGYGPAITYRTHLHPICTCLCPQSYNSPRCQFPSDQIEVVTD